MLRNWIALGLLLGAGLAGAQPRGTMWQQALDADPAFAPLAADLMPDRPGLEVIVTTMNPAQTLCFGAQGEPLWNTPLGEGLSPATPVALGGLDRGGALLAIGASDGAIVALDAATGTERWRTPMPAPAKALLWTNIDGGGNATLIAAAGERIVALDATGQTRWTHTTEGVAGALAAGDIDDTGVVRIFGVSGSQVFALDAVGQPLWVSALPDEVAGTLLLSDADGDRRAEVYAVRTGTAPALIAFDADTGAERWQTLLDSLPAFQPTGMVASDLERDGAGEILVSGAGGLVVLHADGKLLWSLATDSTASPELLLADLDRDARVDVVVAVPGHALLLLRADGTLQYRGTDPAPAAGALVTDLDGDRTLELILAGTGRTLYALRTSGFATPVLTPWPIAGASAARENAMLADPALADPGFVLETVSLLANGGFESGLDGWQAEQAEVLSKAPEAMSGSGALQVAGGATAHSTSVALEPAVHTLTALVFGKGEGVKGATVAWSQDGRVLRSDRLRALPANAQGWRRFTANNLIRPAAADHVMLLLESLPAHPAPVAWDEASLLAGMERIPQIRVLVNQVGFEPALPKRFTVMSSTATTDARFVLLDDSGAPRHEGVLGEGKRIVDAFGNAWDGYYHQGDFSGFEEEGSFRLQVTTGELSAMSAPFTIQQDLYLTQLMAPALRFLHTHRVAGGGWQAPGAAAAGDPGFITHALAELVEMLSWRLKDSGGSAAPPPALVEEMTYGVGALLQAPTGSSAAAALARAARQLPEETELPGAARKALETVDTNAPDPMVFNAVVNLLMLSMDESLQAIAEKQLPAPPAHCAEALLLYEPMSLTGEPLSFTLAMDLAAAADALILQANNPFGVYTSGSPEKPDFFGTTAEETAQRGNSHRLLDAARIAAQAYRFNPREEYLWFIFDQLNWVLGNNPEGVSLMAGMGSESLPAFHGCARVSACLGGIAEGFVGRGPGDDRPYLALSATADRSATTSALALDNVVAWLQTIGHLKRIRR